MTQPPVLSSTLSSTLSSPKVRLKVWTDPSHYDADHRRWLTDILKAHWNDSSSTKRRETYGEWQELYEVEPDLDTCDVVLLPMKWNFYVDNRRESQACAFAEQVRESGKPLLIFSEGDWTARLPAALKDAHLWQVAGYRSRLLANEQAGPPIFHDLLEQFCDGSLIELEPKEKPTISFCGQAGGSALTFAARRLRVLGRWLTFHARIRRWEPMPFETTALRARAVRSLESSSVVDTNFLIRDRYFAGASTAVRNDGKSTPRTEFIHNLLSSPYVLCVRGSGNYSLRFFEGLCLGRLPVLLDTDCPLPFADSIDWDKVCVRVPLEDFERDNTALAEALAHFHEGLAPGELAERQRLARQIWLDHLGREGFYRTLAKAYSAP